MEGDSFAHVPRNEAVACVLLMYLPNLKMAAVRLLYF